MSRQQTAALRRADLRGPPLAGRDGPLSTRRSPTRSGSTAPTCAASTCSSARAPCTAGRLAEATGLTSGAMTAAIDRLERAGFARRVPRLRQIAAACSSSSTPGCAASAARFYGEHIAKSERLYQRYSATSSSCCSSSCGGREFNERHAAALEAAKPREGRRLSAAPPQSVSRDRRRTLQTWDMGCSCRRY